MLILNVKEDERNKVENAAMRRHSASLLPKDHRFSADSQEKRT
ncbi:hypothetical protein [Agrobacterium larrymoorei]